MQYPPLPRRSRTIMRAIEPLKSEYNAPIEYDAANRGYFLLNPNWEQNVPLMSKCITLDLFYLDRVFL